MTEQILNGQCLCGAVTITATAAIVPRLRACHCDMCRQHCSGPFVSIETDPASVKLTGPVKTFQSSDWAERGFCDRCGSTLFYRTPEDDVRNLSAGVFDNAGNGEMKIEFFSDMCPQGYALSGGHKKLTSKETIALFAPNEGETQ